MFTKKMVLLLLILALLLPCFSSCSFTERENSSSQGEEPVTITWYWDAGDVTLPEDSWICKKILNTLGIRYIHISSGRDNYYSKLQSLIASDNIPDIIESNVKQTQKMVKYDLLVPVNEYLNERYLKNAIHISKNWEKAVTARTEPNGQIWAIPSTVGSNPTPLPWIRYDWLENLGLDIPQTYGELAKVLTAFTHNDPDQNGQHDTTGAFLRGSQLSVISFNFGCSPARWYFDSEDGYELGMHHPRCKEYISYMRKLITDGGCSINLATISQTQIDQQIKQGKTGFVLCSPDATSPKSLDPKADWRQLPLPRGIYDKGYLPLNSIIEKEYVISKNCRDILSALKLMDAMAEDLSNFEQMDHTGLYWSLSYGQRGINWDVTDEGVLDFTGNYFPHLKEANADYPYLGLCKRWRNQFEEYSRQLALAQADFMVLPTPIEYPEEIEISREHLARPLDQEGVLFPDTVDRFCQESLKNWPNLFYSVVVGGAPLELQWETWLETAEGNHYKEVKVLAQDALER